MLPSTGYFKTIICPFYENGACDRPYCHFKHLRKENVSHASSTATVGAVSGAQASEHDQKGGTPAAITPNPEMIQQLVTEAVHKVLADQGVEDKDKVSENIVSKVVEGLKPTLTPTIGRHVGVPQLISKPPCVYNPTPISELKKRHNALPVYISTRDSKATVKRKSEDTPTPWLSSLPESMKSKSSELTYTPTAIVNNSNTKDNVPSYVPTAKFESSLNSLDDSNSSDHTTKRKEAYYPKLKKRREEYVPKMIKPPLQSVQQLDDMALDAFDSEFGMIDDILVANEQNSAQPSHENSQDCFDVEAKFSDDEDIESSTKEVQKNSEKTGNDKAIYCEEDAGSEKNFESRNKKNISNKSKKDDSREDRSSASSESLSAGDKIKSSRETSNKENTKRDSHRRRKDSSSGSNKSRDKDRKASRNKDRELNSNSSAHRSSSQRDDKSSHRGSRDSSRRSGEKSRSSRDKSSKENDKSHHKSSRQDKDESSRSRSSKKSSHSSSRHRSSKSRKGRNDSADERSESDHGDAGNGASESYMDVDDLLASSDSDNNVEEECFKIFQEYQGSEHPKGVTTKPEAEKPEVEDLGKKRVAHPSAASAVVRTLGPSEPPKRLPNPQQRMYERWRMMRETVGKTADAKTLDKEPFVQHLDPKPRESPVKSVNSELQVNGNGRVRIAPVPYAMSLALRKKAIEAATKAPETKTAAQNTKSGPRVAHIPQTVPQLTRHEPLQVATQKFPLNVRQYYVNLMHDICVQIYTSGEDAVQRALREELGCHERCKALPVYKNSCMLAAHRLRKEVDQSSTDGPAPSGSGMVSHDAVLAGKTKGSWSVVKTKKAITNFKGSALYCMLKKWILTEEQLRNNGFPRPHPDGTKGRAKVYVTTRNAILSKVPNERYCSRCGQAYMVDRRGLPVLQQNCIHHWGRKFTIRGEGRYSCCQQYGSATGCSEAKNHVWDHVDRENLRGYVKTLPKEIAAEDQGVYALDCEMSYTTQGLELTRVTVIDEDCKVIYETLVMPENPIIDHNTRFSGIKEEDMLGVKTTILDVQATLLTMFSSQTILVGHSLESDFKALKLIHSTVVDTSTVFPHKNGYPQKRALRNLCSEYLRKIIQNDVGGHDSNEDAVACMELIHWKVKEEAKLQ